MNSEFFNYSLRLKDVVCALTLFAQEPLSISLRATRLSDYESAGVHTFTCARVMLCKCDVLHTEVKTLDLGVRFRNCLKQDLQDLWDFQDYRDSFVSCGFVMISDSSCSSCWAASSVNSEWQVGQRWW